MTLKNIKQQGFTIVELLIVIVVIAILAAITIVAYNGVQNRSKLTAAQSAATNTAKKAELYNTDKSSYATSLSTLTGATGTDVFQLTGVTAVTAAPSTAPTATNTVWMYNCTGGAKIGFWDYVGNAAVTDTYNTNGVSAIKVGNPSGTCTIAT
jgi:prepilin-type N-terminal cleavage/methylation domain-containing protein